MSLVELIIFCLLSSEEATETNELSIVLSEEATDTNEESIVVILVEIETKELSIVLSEEATDTNELSIVLNEDATETNDESMVFNEELILRLFTLSVPQISTFLYIVIFPTELINKASPSEPALNNATLFESPEPAWVTFKAGPVP
jgi:hypothetical protein